ncbi:MAG: histidine kinase [Oscillospiraceae bacterium]|nr:histidine kinase [Oscillospiraceae bacterium]
MSGAQLLNLITGTVGITLSLVGTVMAAKVPSLQKKKSAYLQALYLCLAAYLFFSLTEQLSRMHQLPAWTVVTRTAIYAKIFSGSLMPVILGDYLCWYLNDREKPRPLLTVVRLLFALQVLLLTITQFNGMYYTVSENNIFLQGPYDWLSLLLAGLPLVLELLLYLRFRKRLMVHERNIFFAFLLLPIIGLAFQTAMRAVYTVVGFTSLAAGVLLFYLLQEQQQIYYSWREELAELRVSIAVSQIQPHFLYNTLDSIYYLCEMNPQKAQEAISRFSDYLRMNLASLQKSECISFSEEKQHTELYLELEKLSSEDTLHYTFDCRTTAFLLPALTVQPLVENAVKHGVGQKQGGGTVTVRTWQEDECFCITIEDDGVGFDPNSLSPKESGRIGIENVRRRLADMSGASLQIESCPGRGTRAEIRIPRERGNP